MILLTKDRVFPRLFTHGRDLSPHMGGQVQRDKALMGGLMRGDVTLIDYSTGRSQHNTDFAKTNQNEVVRILTNFFEDF